MVSQNRPGASSQRCQRPYRFGRAFHDSRKRRILYTGAPRRWSESVTRSLLPVTLSFLAAYMTPSSSVQRLSYNDGNVFDRRRRRDPATRRRRFDARRQAIDHALRRSAKVTALLLFLGSIRGSALRFYEREAHE